MKYIYSVLSFLRRQDFSPEKLSLIQITHYSASNSLGLVSRLRGNDKFIPLRQLSLTKFSLASALPCVSSPLRQLSLRSSH